MTVRAIGCGRTAPEAFDHADVYGASHRQGEARFDQSVTPATADRESIGIQAEVGVRHRYFDFSQKQIVSAMDHSLAAPRTDCLDVLPHRPEDGEGSAVRGWSPRSAAAAPDLCDAHDCRLPGDKATGSSP